MLLGLTGKSKTLLLTRNEWAIIEQHWADVLEHLTAPMPQEASSDGDGDNVKLWIKIKEVRSVAYLRVTVFKGKKYVDIRDFYTPKDDPESGLRYSPRGITLDQAGWRRLKALMPEIETRWVGAELYAGVEPNNTLRVDDDEDPAMVDDSQRIVLD